MIRSARMPVNLPSIGATSSSVVTGFHADSLIGKDQTSIFESSCHQELAAVSRIFRNISTARVLSVRDD